MPPKEYEPYVFTFTYEQETYLLNSFRIYDSNNKYICDCDLSVTKYYGNQEITLLCCRIALDAYYAGKADGKTEHKKEVGSVIKDLLGL